MDEKINQTQIDPQFGEVQKIAALLNYEKLNLSSPEERRELDSYMASPVWGPIIEENILTQNVRKDAEMLKNMNRDAIDEKIRRLIRRRRRKVVACVLFAATLILLVIIALAMRQHV